MVHPSAVDLLVPVKSLNEAKSRLRRTLGHVDGDAHRALALAMLSDTVVAALCATRVRRVAVVTPDPDVLSVAAALGAVPLHDTSEDGLNASLTFGEAFLCETEPRASIGVLQADLPALRAAELDKAIDAARSKRAICADRQGSGTTLLLAGHGRPTSPFVCGSVSPPAAPPGNRPGDDTEGGARGGGSPPPLVPGRGG